MRRENMYYTAITLPPGVITTVAGAIPLVVLSFTGFHQEEDADDDDSVRGQYRWTQGSIWVLRIFGFLLSCALALYSFYLVKNFTITQKISNQLNTQISKMEEEENRSMDESLKVDISPELHDNNLAEDDRLQLLHLSVEENR
jgi:Na+/melibiose symporter-like transporter